jgi:hypothetical protein
MYKPEPWYVVIIDTPEGRRIGIDRLSSGMDINTSVSNPLLYDEAVQLCKELSEQLNIKQFEH